MQRYSDSEILEFVEGYMHSSKNPDLVGYREQTYTRDFADKERFLWFVKSLAQLGDYQAKRVLDVGCGCGWHAFTVSLLDDRNEVIGLDILPSMIDAATDCIRAMRAKGIHFNMTALRGDICDPPIELNSLDAIYSTEAIEHVHDIDAMLNRCFSLLRPGGTIILVNDQNLFDRRGKADTLEMYEKREHSWEWCDYLKKLRPIEHGNAKPFAIMREEIVRTTNSSLSDSDVGKIVHASAGLRRLEIEQLAKQYMDGLALPKRPELDWCRNPETGEYAERLFDPFAVAAKMRAHGFTAKVRHMFRKVPAEPSQPHSASAIEHIVVQRETCLCPVRTEARLAFTTG